MRHNLRTNFILIGTLISISGCYSEKETNAGLDSISNQVNQTNQVTSPNAIEDDLRNLVSKQQRKAWFGDLHLHTGMSFDSAAASTSTTPEEAYRFAQGESVEYFGRQVQRNVPLDFLAVTDHAEYLGLAVIAKDEAGPFADTDWPAKLIESSKDMITFLRIFSPAGFRGEEPIPEFVTENIIRSNWQRQKDAAEQYYRPGEFTSFIAFEWSPMPGGAHMHRNVIFKGPSFPERPFSAIDSMNPEDLWTYTEARIDEGIDVILIPHNSNLSEGLMFAFKDSYGNDITNDYAERRSNLERLVEITQIKGTSETRPEFSPNDEFSNFELINWGADDPTVDLSGGYVRTALKRGLELQDTLNVNPFKLGIVGGSDFHSGLSSSEENNFPGGLGDGDEQSNPEKVLTSVNPLMGSPTTVMSASGLTGIWAEENTRESLFDGLKRREVFATSGNRIRVRMFASWEFENNILRNSEWVKEAYSQGVPMGADLSPTLSNKTPQFLLQAVKDPNAGNLDRIQIIKVWLEDGIAQERIFNAVWAGNRTLDSEGNLTSIGNTVNISAANYSNNIGVSELLGEWTDPEFNPEQATIYYARVLEIPTPRWSTYLAVQNNLPLSTDVPATIQERAWTSPIFYTP